MGDVVLGKKEEGERRRCWRCVSGLEEEWYGGLCCDDDDVFEGVHDGY